MNLDGFWELLERSRQETDNQDARLEWLTTQLAQQPTAEIVDFQICLDQARRRADTWQLWGAAYYICDSLCSGDGFHSFQAWLIGLGRETFERAVADPDSLASVPEVLRLAGRPTASWRGDEWPHWEALDSVAWQAYQQVTGEDDGLFDAIEARGHRLQALPHPRDERWVFEDPVEAEHRLPRLSWMFQLTDRATRDQRGREAFERMLAQRGQTEEEFIAWFLGRGGHPTPPQEPPDRA
jgi:Protein of unknown function (DUF4240)